MCTRTFHPDYKVNFTEVWWKVESAKKQTSPFARRIFQKKVLEMLVSSFSFWKPYTILYGANLMLLRIRPTSSVVLTVTLYADQPCIALSVGPTRFPNRKCADTLYTCAWRYVLHYNNIPVCDDAAPFCVAANFLSPVLFSPSHLLHGFRSSTTTDMITVCRSILYPYTCYDTGNAVVTWGTLDVTQNLLDLSAALGFSLRRHTMHAISIEQRPENRQSSQTRGGGSSPINIFGRLH